MKITFEGCNYEFETILKGLKLYKDKMNATLKLAMDQKVVSSIIHCQAELAHVIQLMNKLNKLPLDCHNV